MPSTYLWFVCDRGTWIKEKYKEVLKNIFAVFCSAEFFWWILAMQWSTLCLERYSIKSKVCVIHYCLSVLFTLYKLNRVLKRYIFIQPLSTVQTGIELGGCIQYSRNPRPPLLHWLTELEKTCATPNIISSGEVYLYRNRFFLHINDIDAIFDHAKMGKINIYKQRKC